MAIAEYFRISLHEYNNTKFRFREHGIEVKLYISLKVIFGPF